MNCLKCGGELPEAGGVFCPECLEQMAQRPVPPGSKVSLPDRSGSGAEESQPKPKPKAEEIIAGQKRQLLQLRRMVFAMGLIIALLIGALALLGNFGSIREYGLGQNYLTTETTNP